MMKTLRMCLGIVVPLAVVVAGCVSSPKAGTSVKPFRPQRPAVYAAMQTPAKPSLGTVRKSEPMPVVSTNRSESSVFEKTERVLRSGDRVQVTIYAPPEPFTCPNVIDEDGRINFPLIGAMTVAGKSCGEAQRMVERAYIDQKIYKTVTVIIVPPESEYAVTGEVIRPGPYPLTRDLTLLQALARSGRYTEYADKGRVYLIRDNERVEIKLDDIRQGRRRDITIIPGDVIEVPRSPW